MITSVGLQYFQYVPQLGYFLLELEGDFRARAGGTISPGRECLDTKVQNR